jgi:hypothetical protein
VGRGHEASRDSGEMGQAKLPPLLQCLRCRLQCCPTAWLVGGCARVRCPR